MLRKNNSKTVIVKINFEGTLSSNITLRVVFPGNLKSKKSQHVYTFVFDTMIPFTGSLFLASGSLSLKNYYDIQGVT